MRVCHSARVEVRGYRMDVSYLLLSPCGPWGQTRVIKLGAKCLFLLSHLWLSQFLFACLFLKANVYLYVWAYLCGYMGMHTQVLAGATGESESPGAGAARSCGMHGMLGFKPWPSVRPVCSLHHWAISLAQRFVLFVSETRYSWGWPHTCPVAKGDLEVLMLLSPQHKCCVSRQVPSCLIHVVLRIKPRASLMPGKVLYQLRYIRSSFLSLKKGVGEEEQSWRKGASMENLN